MSSRLPSRLEAWALMKAAAPPDWVIGHVECVEALAMAMASAAEKNGHKVDKNLVQAGAILHDYGRAVTQEPNHAHVGAEQLREFGLHEEVVTIVERHTGGGISPDEASALDMPPKDYTPKTLEQKIVAHADNLYSGAKRLDLEALRRKYKAKSLPVAMEKIESLHHELCEVCGTDLELLEPLNLTGTGLPSLA